MYNYQKEKQQLFTEEGLNYTLKVRDVASELSRDNNLFKLDRLMNRICGDTWKLMAAVDFLCEKGWIYEVTKGQDIITQHRIYSFL